VRVRAISLGSAPAPEVAPVLEQTAEATGPWLQWDRLNSSDFAVRRAAVPGGWLVVLGAGGVTFLPDPKHAWDGGSVRYGRR